MLENIRIFAQTYDQIRESEQHYKTPGFVEVIVEVLHQNAEAGEESWERAARCEGSPEEAVALAEQFIHVAQQLKRVAQDAARKGEACRVRADQDFVE